MNDQERITLVLREEWLIEGDEVGVLRWEMRPEVAEMVASAIMAALADHAVTSTGARGQG